MSSILKFGQILVHLANVRGAAVSSHSLDWTPKGIPWVWRHMRGFLKSRCDSHAPSLNKFTSFGESFLRLYCSVRYVLQLKVTFHVCPCIPTYISRLKFAFATLPAQLPALNRWRPSSNVRALVNTGSRLLRGAYREKWRRQNGVASAPDRSANYTKICS